MTTTSATQAPLTAAYHDDRKKVATQIAYRLATATEVKEASGGFFLDRHGRLSAWRRNGVTQTWKRDIERFRVPAKYGFREAFAWETDGQGGVRCESGGTAVPVVVIE